MIKLVLDEEDSDDFKRCHFFKEIFALYNVRVSKFSSGYDEVSKFSSEYDEVPVYIHIGGLHSSTSAISVPLENY